MDRMMVFPLLAILKQEGLQHVVCWFAVVKTQTHKFNRHLLLLYLLSNSRTELAVAASSPDVGSSRKRTAGSFMSSMPIIVLFFSPPEIPLIISVPTCRNHADTQDQSRVGH